MGHSALCLPVMLKRETNEENQRGFLKDRQKVTELKVIYHPLYDVNNCVTNKSKLSQDGAQVFPYMG